jgi:microcystin-dependent protein
MGDTMKCSLAATALASILHLTRAGLASAQGQYLSEVRLFGSNFCPVGWLKADGRLMEIAQNTALFSLLGTTYGGDGKRSFALPNLTGRAPYGAGGGNALGVVFGALSAARSNELGNIAGVALAMNWCIAVDGSYSPIPY